MDEENKIDQPIEDNPSSEQEQPVDDTLKTEREVADIDTSDDCEKEDMTAEDEESGTEDSEETDGEDEEEAPPKKKRRKLKLILIIILCVFLSIVIVLVSTFFILAYIGKMQFRKGNTQISVSGIEDIKVYEDEVVYKDKTYVLNEDVVAVLFIGIDKKNISDDLGYGKNGQADCLFIAALDTDTKAITIIPISREIMTDINIYSTQGKYTGTQKKQICLAYSYGKTAEESSQNVLTAVRRMFFGINISSYVTVDLHAIEELTNEIGGVTVKCLEEMKIGGKTVKKGDKVTLKGKDATTYIQYRKKDIDANNRRMARQKQFLNTLASKAGNEILSNFTRLGSFYNAVVPYSSTDLTFSQITYLVSNCLSSDIGSKFEYKTIEGTAAMGEKWVEFTPSQESLLDIVIDVFYTEKE